MITGNSWGLSDLVIENKLSSRSNCAALRQVNPIYKKDP